MFAELLVEEFDLPHLNLVQIDLHFARQVEGAAEEGDGVDLRPTDTVCQLLQFVDVAKELF